MPPRPTNPLDDIVQMLNAGMFAQAIPLLHKLSRSTPSEPGVFYNLGLAHSATGQFPEAVISLKRCLELAPAHHNAWVGLAVAYGHMRNLPDARSALVQALKLRPNDGLTLQNFAGILGMLGEHEAAADAARQAMKLLPPNERTHWALAASLKNWAIDQKSAERAKGLRAEASDALKAFLELYPDSPMAEDAEKALTLISEVTLRERGLGPDGFRPDILEYILHALQLYDEMGADVRNHIVLEVAKVGAEGLDINDPETRHAIRGLPGDYTALQLVAFMYTGMQQVNPSVHAGADFKREYDAALSLHARRKTQQS